MAYTNLLSPYSSGAILLRNRVVMAPMNRRRATNGIPNASMATYYRQRAGAGLLITDNTLISSNSGEYMDTPGIFTEEQKQGWRKIVEAVHSEGGKIFMQLVHGGRVGHPLVQHGEPLIAPSAIRVHETISVPGNQYLPMPEPVALTTEEVPVWVDAFVHAAEQAVAVGFDGVEIHAAHGFLIDQFTHPHSNTRTDHYGGSIENRTRFLVEVMRGVVAAIGKDRTGIRLSPFRTIYGLQPYPEELATHQYILDALQALDILYVHFSNAVVQGQSTIPVDFLKDARQRFSNLIMIAGGYDVENAEALLASGMVDLVAFGKLFISNPDLVERIERKAPLAEWDEATFYHGGDRGFIDYPRFEQVS